MIYSSVILISATAIFMGLYHVMIKLSSVHVHQILGAFILQLTASVVGIIVIAYLKYFTSVTIQPIEQKGIYLAVLAGIFVGLSEILTFYIFSRGLPVSTVVPIIIGGSIVVASLVGFVFLKEQFNISIISGLVLIIFGIFLVSK